MSKPLSSDVKFGMIAGALMVPFGVLVVTVLSAYHAFSTGFVLAKFWIWYAVPYGLPAIHWSTFGVGCLAFNLIRDRRTQKGEEEKSTSTKWAEFVGYVVAPWIALLIGWWLL
jgi:uncharacterized protein (DUF2062 family)